MFYSPEPVHIFLQCQIALYDLTPCQEPEKIRIAFGKPFTALRLASPRRLIKKRRSAWTQLLSSIPCNSREEAWRALFVAGFKTAAFPDLQKLSGLPHLRRRQPRM